MKKERYIDMKSPLTGGRVKLIEDIEEHVFRKEKYMIHVRYYLCEDSGEQFTMEGQDELLCNELYSQYRIRHGIPFADEIRSLRERYKLNYTQISKIMGFGMNQWKQYEQGVVPSESNGKIIVTIRRKECMIALLEASKSEFEKNEYEKIKANIINANETEKTTLTQQLMYGKTERSLLNGFSEMNCDKLQEMIRTLIMKEGGSVCPTKLNKEMFYADFQHFRYYGHSISGLQYRALQYGPVPEHYDTIYDNVDGIAKESVIQFDTESIRLHLITPIEKSNLTDKELKTLSMVSDKFNALKTSEVVEISHKESAWLNHVAGHNLIPYSEAFDLKAIE